MSDPTKHIGVSQIGPAVTTMSWENPGYGVLTIDKETMLPMNFEIYAMDLVKANASGTPTWEVTTDYVKDYELKNNNVSPDSMYDLGERMVDDRTLASLFRWNLSRNVKEPTNMSASEMKDQSCMVTTSETWETDECNGRKNHTSLFHSPGDWLFNFVIGEWVVKTDEITQ
jgi:hypothetical protein